MVTYSIKGYNVEDVTTFLAELSEDLTELIREKNTLTVHFVLTDLKQEIPVTYSGILPDLFHEGNGAIAEGQWSDSAEKPNIFKATEILAKHDEKYMPRAVYDALRNDLKNQP